MSAFNETAAVTKLVAACEAVVANWERGDLAQAARMCAEALNATSSTQREQHLEQLLDKAAAAGLEHEDLDETVHELAASIAADINNSGLDGQLGYLLDELGYEATSKRIDELAGEPD